MKTLEMSITPDYVPHWDIAAALREFLQNALDAQVSGHRLEISSDANSVHITNYGAELPLKTLLLGTTTKTGDETTIGQFGEGYKLGCLVLTRNCIEMSISSPIGTLYPSITYSDNYKTKILSFALNEDEKFLPGVRVSFSAPVTESWLRSLVLLDDPYTPRVLKDLPGMVYLNGLQINLEKPVKTEDHWHWGYNLPPTLSLDRDRMMVSEYALRQHIISVIFGTETIESIYNALRDQIPEIKDLERYNIPTEKDKQIRDMFLSFNGVDAYALSNTRSLQSEETVVHADLNPVTLSSNILLSVLRRKQPSWGEVEELARRKLNSFKETSLNPEQERNFTKAKETLKHIIPTIQVTSVVFPQSNLRGLYLNGQIYLSIKCFSTVGELVVNIIHEALHETIPGHDKEFWQEFENRIGEVLTAVI